MYRNNYYVLQSNINSKTDVTSNYKLNQHND